MGIPNRIYKMSKAYLDQVRDRIDAELTEREQAQRELENSLDPGASSTSFGRSGGGNSSDRGDDISNAEEMMRRAEERIASARRELESRNELDRRAAAAAASAGTGDATTKKSASERSGSRTSGGNDASVSGTVAAAEQADPNAGDFRVLGVPVGSDLAVVQTAYEQLSRRCDPRRFPDNSAEQKDAERILVRVNSAYEALHKRLDPTENRFGKLELE